MSVVVDQTVLHNHEWHKCTINTRMKGKAVVYNLKTASTTESIMPPSVFESGTAAVVTQF
jgi:hypothetical protein